MLKKLNGDSFLAYIFLAFVAMAGLSYINFLPGLVNALAGGLGFGEAEAGRIVALNGYGGIVGTTAAIFLIRRIEWRKAMLLSLAVLAVVDLATIWVNDYGAMLGWRFLAGTVGGLCVGIAFSVLARLGNPDRAFGLLLFVQFSIGSIVIYMLPGLEELLSAHAVFVVMASFVLLSWFFLLFLPALSNEHRTTNHTITLSANTFLLMVGILAYQVAASGIWAYVGLIGLRANIAADNVSMYIAITGMLGLAGAMLPVIAGRRFGRLNWVLAGIALSIAAALLLRFSHMPLLYVLSMALLFFSWPAVQSFLLAVTAEMDGSGQLSTIAGVVSSVGLASGPLLTSSLLDEGSFTAMLVACAAFFLLSFLLLIKPVEAKEKAGRRWVARAMSTLVATKWAIACHKKVSRFVKRVSEYVKEKSMIRYILNKTLVAMQQRYDYDVGYMQDILKTDLKAFLKYLGFQIMGSHKGNLPAGPLFAARIRAIIWDDCGPCTQLVVDMALEAKLSPDLVRAIIDRDLNNLPKDIAMVVKFTELVLAHNLEADELREEILALWGMEGLIAIGYAISSSRVYPALKYTLGYGKACSRISVNELTLAPSRQPALVMGVDNV